MSSLRTCISIKSDKNAEPYTYILNKFIWRRALAKLRCGVIDIGVNIDRKNKIPYDQRICKFCNLNRIDDEYHFILICPFSGALRTKYIPRYYIEHPDGNKFIILLSSTTVRLNRSISIYIIKACELRKTVQV